MTTPEGADGAAWRVQLERWHAELANTIDQASLWAREFHVRTGDGRWGDSSAPPSYPLLGYAHRLEQIGATLKMVCANASLDPPVLSWDRTTLKAPPRIRIPGRDPDWREADYSEGGQYLLYIRPSTPNPDIVTARQHWRTALGLAAPSVLERQFGIPQLATYASQAQGLFDIAHDTIRAAFRDSVAATFGRIWATWPTPSDGGRPLLMWMTELMQFGCSIEECEAVLRDIEVVDPQAVAMCRAGLAPWLQDTT
ncbi:Uncharacterised protein [Mycobacteroides abscessus subsp. massiliense]|uniref:Uncharacterized protein n=1 Tax=Mycolicibacterium fortuitum subsp. acetamidolyticum TaxID=144550 RepID=A0A100WXZ8_MYCFO|nr:MULTISPECIES: hypothetical protein [Mycobacteriaceae]MCV7143863.1 hypothetical protein [Mycolicibacterium fortuitum]SKM23412.1 Uncharacterised protein [Mycobacteroides abscessus subsp. abscessus]SKM87711.1 Uncharacterised protein [Mycobacteroides abscessus subsp. massiliense]SKN98935.1 Uncharacterised protein [Mycobacteroides abscessus subsp. massiliense]SKO00657.1 Uncharacterised protein [Mycobacteroides abscessus subsp. massiliense]